MGTNWLSRELKRGSAKLLVLALIEQRARHGYEIARLIEQRPLWEGCFAALNCVARVKGADA